MNSDLASTDQQYLMDALPVGGFGLDAVWTAVKRRCNRTSFWRYSGTTP
jgi:hypothetical protein